MRLEELNHAIKTNTVETERSISALATSTTAVVNARLEQLSQAIKNNSSESERSLAQLAASTTNAIRTSAQDAERSLTGMSAGVSNVLKQNATEVERTMLGVSAEVARNFVGKADEITAALSARSAEMNRILDEKSSGLILALGDKSSEFANEVSRVTEHAVKAIEAKGFTFTQTMMDNSEQIARLINEASETATSTLTKSIKDLHSSTQSVTTHTVDSVTQSVKELQSSTEMATKAASTTIGRTLRELQEQTHAAVETSKQTAAAAVSEMLETHGMLRSDTTALFERLREANILLQEVLSGAHENMSAIESTLVTRVADFVTAMNEVASKTGTANSQVEQHISAFQSITSRTLVDLGQLAGQFDAHGRSLAEAVALIDRSNRRTEATVGERREALEALVTALDSKGSELEQRISRFSGHLERSLDTATRAFDSKSEALDRRVARFSGTLEQTLVNITKSLEGKSEDLGHRLTSFSELLDQSLESANDRTRDIARMIAEATNQGARAIAENLETIRSANEHEYKRTSDAMRAVYDQTTQDAELMLTPGRRAASPRWSTASSGWPPKCSASSMPPAPSCARAFSNCRRRRPKAPPRCAVCMVEQIEALAELNRIVARHGIDTVEPATRARSRPPRRWASAASCREEPVHANGSSSLRAEVPVRERERRRHHRHGLAAGCAGPPGGIAIAKPRRRATRRQPQRLAVRSPHPRFARRRGASRRTAGSAARERRRRRHRTARASQHRVARFARCRHRAHDRPRSGRRAVGPLQARRAQRVHPQALHHAGPAHVRGNPQEVPGRSRVHADRGPLHRRVRAAARRGRARRPRTGGGAHLPHLGDRQGLHHARARRGTLRLSFVDGKQGGRAPSAPVFRFGPCGARVGKDCGGIKNKV